MRPRVVIVVMAVCASAVCTGAGCATRGGGSGRVAAPGKPAAEGEARFTWRADARAMRGTIRAELPDGRVFRGRFVQATSETLVQDLGPHESTGGAPTYAWDQGAHDSAAFVRHYSGRVLAELDGPRGERMRCRFELARPEDGPSSGGVGECEVSSGETIERAMLRGERE